MNTFLQLALLDAGIFEQPASAIFHDVALVCVQHLLETTGSLIEKFIEIGFAPKNIHVLGKLYSTNPDVQQRLRELGIHVYESGACFAWGGYSRQLSADIALMWQHAMDTGAFDRVRKIVVLDDGGGCIAAAPFTLVNAIPTVGVEQTMSGITLNRCEKPAIPFVGVGSSAAKVLIEPRIIQEALFQRVAQKTCLGIERAGIVGNGYIGRAVGAGLASQGISVAVYDTNESQLHDVDGLACSSLADLYDSSDTIWGCTGVDHLKGHDWLPYFSRPKTLISCSSKDSEFRSVLDLVNEVPQNSNISRLSDVTVTTSPCSSTRILRGGFPINFDGTPESAPAHDIQITRALLFCGVLQAVLSVDDCAPGVDIALEPRSQMKIVSRWFELNPTRRLWYAPAVINVFQDEERVRLHEDRWATPAPETFQVALASQF